MTLFRSHAPLKRLNSKMFGLKHAINGLVELIKNERNARFHLVSTAVVIYVGWKVGFEPAEWLWISLAVAGVWVAELLNTSLERITDLVSPEQSELAKKAKDYAKAPIPEIEEFIFSAGFYHAKARHLKGLGAKLIEDFDVRTPSPYVAAGKLSGGNQQKVIVARELSRDVKLVIASQPTRGLDVGSIEYIHRQIVQMRDRGVAVLLISAELDEILALSDRIAVMYRGEILTTVDAAAITKEKLGLWMAGIQPK